MEVSLKVICDLICDLPITATWHITLHLLLSESSRKRPCNKVYDTAVTGYTDRHLNPLHCPTMEPRIIAIIRGSMVQRNDTYQQEHAVTA